MGNKRTSGPRSDKYPDIMDEVKFEKSDWVPVSDIVAKRNTYEPYPTVTFYCKRCFEEIGRFDLREASLYSSPSIPKHKCKEKKDESNV